MNWVGAISAAAPYTTIHWLGNGNWTRPQGNGIGITEIDGSVADRAKRQPRSDGDASKRSGTLALIRVADDAHQLVVEGRWHRSELNDGVVVAGALDVGVVDQGIGGP